MSCSPKDQYYPILRNGATMRCHAVDIRTSHVNSPRNAIDWNAEWLERNGTCTCVSGTTYAAGACCESTELLGAAYQPISLAFDRNDKQNVVAQDRSITWSIRGDKHMDHASLRRSFFLGKSPWDTLEWTFLEAELQKYTHNCNKHMRVPSCRTLQCHDSLTEQNQPTNEATDQSNQH